MRINPYLNFNGQCEEALTFYAKTLGGKINALMRYAGTPAEEHCSKDMANQIIHGCITIDGMHIMASDCPPEMFSPMKGMTVALHIDDVAEAERAFNALAEGGTVEMPFQPTFWAKGYGSLTDKFGTPWMVNCNLPYEQGAEPQK